MISCFRNCKPGDIIVWRDSTVTYMIESMPCLDGEGAPMALASNMIYKNPATIYERFFKQGFVIKVIKRQNKKCQS